jgi:hypothetical protein
MLRGAEARSNGAGMSIEYCAAIAEDDYETFRALLTTILPSNYEMWLRVRARGKARAFKERSVVLREIDISPQQFHSFCTRMKKPDFSIATLDRCAREKALIPDHSKT